MTLWLSSKGRHFALFRLVSIAMIIFMTVLSSANAQKSRKKAVKPYSPPYAAIIVDVKTGKVLHSQNADARRYPASLTKVMTLYLLFEQLDAGKLQLTSRFPVSHYAANRPPSKIGVRAGDSITVQQAIEALVTKSANDAASVIAEALGGSESKFAVMMTRKAKKLGMKNTVFQNPHGLPDTRQYTTARDLAILGQAIQDHFPDYYRFFKTSSFTYKNAVHRNHNRLLGQVEGVDGIKTGYTNASGFNLLTNAKTGNRHIVAVVLGGRSAYLRDQAMTQLIGRYMPAAYAGRRTAPIMKGRGAENIRLAAVDVTSTGTLSDAKQISNSKEPLQLHNVRSVVTTAKGMDTAVTPGFVDARAIHSGKTPSGGRNAGMQFASLPLDAEGNLLSFDEVRTDKPLTVKDMLEDKPNQIIAPKTSSAKVKTEIDKKPVTAPVTVASTASSLTAQKDSGWVIQLAATADEHSALTVLNNAQNKSWKVLKKAEPFTEKFEKDGAVFYRARFSGFDEKKEAMTACTNLKKNGFSCFAARG